MTEIERILNKGVISDRFLIPEEKCDFYIDENRKKIWAIGLDLLMKLDEVCKRHRLCYYLAYGTLLGAIRHNGFIPWDDDIDVCMPRYDYEKLQEHKDEFKDPYFLQSPETDANYFFSFIKLRNSKTTALSKNLCYNNFNNGMSLDIFCVDKWENDDQGKRLYLKINDLIINNSTYMKLSNPYFKDDERVRNYNRANPMIVYREIQRLSKSYYDKVTDYVSMPTISIYGYEKDIFYAEDFSCAILHPFESLNLPIPVGYDRILKCIYGDYMQFPPAEKRGKGHTALLDAERPYTDYLEDLKNGVQLWK